MDRAGVTVVHRPVYDEEMDHRYHYLVSNPSATLECRPAGPVPTSQRSTEGHTHVMSAMNGDYSHQSRILKQNRWSQTLPNLYRSPAHFIPAILSSLATAPTSRDSPSTGNLPSVSPTPVPTCSRKLLQYSPRTRAGP
jgi:hypothetical protein